MLNQSLILVISSTLLFINACTATPISTPSTDTVATTQSVTKNDIIPENKSSNTVVSEEIPVSVIEEPQTVAPQSTETASVPSDSFNDVQDSVVSDENEILLPVMFSQENVDDSIITDSTGENSDTNQEFNEQDLFISEEESSDLFSDTEVAEQLTEPELENNFEMDTASDLEEESDIPDDLVVVEDPVLSDEDEIIAPETEDLALNQPEVEETAELINEFEEKQTETVQYDIPIVENKRVEQLKSFYLYKRRKVLETGLHRSGKYLPMIRKIFAEKNLPLDLAYLVAVESNYHPRARSHKSAVGLWQFIPSTGRLYGLKINKWIDERMDPVKSTESAAKYLTYLYDMFGNWELAVAAYNTGEGRVMRQVRKAKALGVASDFWSLKLPRETRNYVPALMAVTIISKNLKAYGLEHIEPELPMIEDSVKISSNYSLQEISKRAGVSMEELMDLNPALYRGIPPLHEQEYSLVLPKEKHEPLLASLEQNPEPEQRLDKSYADYLDYSSSMTQILAEHGDPVYIYVHRGDNLSTLARKHNTSVQRLMEWNHLHKHSILRINQRLKVYIPTWKVFNLAASRKSQPVIEPPANGYSITVQPGMTLSQLSRRYRVSVNTLMQWNGLTRPSQLRANQKLIVGKTVSRPVSTKNSIDSGKYRVIEVPSGMTLSEIAIRFNTSVEQLLQWNNLDHPRDLKAGQTLIVAPVSSTDKEQPHHVIRIRKGDTLWKIAQTYGTSVEKLLVLNGISSPHSLQPDQTLLVPNMSNDT
ncbi:MAG: LysM peptidoglycan-binding domain-containing protein [SAR324 cluster bacterium]|nr:LysM peptidoglycan-binding domain-containing protein [SAR324 cluster bacterium]